MAASATVRQVMTQQVAVVAVAGELDLASAPDLDRTLQRDMDAGHKVIVVDLSETTFMDSRGTYVLMRAGRELRQRLGQLVIVCDNPDLLRLFELSALTEIVPCFPTRRRALREALAEA